MTKEPQLSRLKALYFLMRISSWHFVFTQNFTYFKTLLRILDFRELQEHQRQQTMQEWLWSWDRTDSVRKSLVLDDWCWRVVLEWLESSWTAGLSLGILQLLTLDAVSNHILHTAYVFYYLKAYILSAAAIWISHCIFNFYNQFLKSKLYHQSHII